jgi:hypothetical protein
MTTSVGEDEVVPVYGFEDLVPLARVILDTLNERRPGELNSLKHELYQFIENHEIPKEVEP